MVYMFHIVVLGFFVGFGFAMSVGPIFLLMVRTNLTYGFWRSMMISFGAVAADMTYLFLLSIGALLILNQPVVLKVVGIVGAIVLLYFGFKTMRSTIDLSKDTLALPAYHRSFMTGYLMCISSPLSILFWAGMAGTIASIATQSHGAIYIFSVSFFVGVMVFVLSLNGLLLVIRHQINPRTLGIFNRIGGVAIMGFGIYGLVKVYGLI